MSYIPKLLFPRSSSGCPTPYIKIPIFPTVLGEATFIQYWIPSCLWLSVHAWTFFSFWAFQPVCQGTAASLFHTLILHDGRKNINHLRDAEDTTLMAESEEELKSLLMKVKEESKKVGLKLIIQISKIMASGPITSWEIDGETVETVSDFIFGGLQNHCRWWLPPWN